MPSSSSILDTTSTKCLWDSSGQSLSSLPKYIHVGVFHYLHMYRNMSTGICVTHSQQGKHLYSFIFIYVYLYAYTIPLHKHNNLLPSKVPAESRTFLQTAAALTSLLGCCDCHVHCITLTGSAIFPQQLMQNDTCSPANIFLV